MRVGFEELAAPKLVCGGAGRLGMPYAFSKISDSVILDRALAGEAELAMAEVGVGSLRELGESRRLDQGGMADLSTVDCGQCIGHWCLDGSRIGPENRRVHVITVSSTREPRRDPYVFGADCMFLPFHEQISFG